jgi:iron(III) transport system ATP-binding protein
MAEALRGEIREVSEYLELRDIRKEFGSFIALKGVSLAVHPGELLCFLGPSGCGKTTLLRIIAGLEVQTSGTVIQAGKDISRLPPMKRDYGIVFQSYALFPNLSIAENVAYGLVNRRVPRHECETRVKQLLVLVGLSDSGEKYPAQLSGGQQQRIAIARAIATSPGLLLLDEPLSALDARVRVRLRGEIRSLQQRLGITTILVTHDQEEALSMADRIVVMNQGVIDQIGTPLEVYRDPRTPFVADFVGRTNLLPATRAGDNRVQVGAQRFECEVDASLAQSTRLKVFFRPEDVILRGVEGATPNSATAVVEKVEFLGAYSRLTFRMIGIDQPLYADLSVNDMEEFHVKPGDTMRVAIPADRVRVFEAAGA